MGINYFDEDYMIAEQEFFFDAFGECESYYYLSDSDNQRYGYNLRREFKISRCSGEMIYYRNSGVLHAKCDEHYRSRDHLDNENDTIISHDRYLKLKLLT